VIREGRLQRRGLGPRDGAAVPHEAAIARDDVDRGAALDLPNAHRGVRRIEARIAGTRLQRFGFAHEEADRRCGHGDRIDAGVGIGGVAGLARDVGAEHGHTLVRVGKPHAGRLAHDRRAGRREFAHVTRDQARSAQAAQLLVETQHEVQGVFQWQGEELRHQRERDGDEAFHIGSAAAVEACLALGQTEWIALP